MACVGADYFSVSQFSSTLKKKLYIADSYGPLHLTRRRATWRGGGKKGTRLRGSVDEKHEPYHFSIRSAASEYVYFYAAAMRVYQISVATRSMYRCRPTG